MMNGNVLIASSVAGRFMTFTGGFNMLKITINGLWRDDKTTLASEIAALLESLKMKVIVKDEGLNKETDRTSIWHQQNLKYIEGCQVEIEIIQTQDDK